MKTSELRQILHDEIYVAAMNKLYHQRKAYDWWWWDKVVKISVASLAAVAFGLVFLPEGWKWLEATAAFLALISAIILNVVPVGEWEAHFSELFRAWSDLQTCADRLRLQISDYTDDQEVERLLIDNFRDLSSREDQLQAIEWAPDEALLIRCQGDINESMYGKGKRTYDEVMAYLQQQELPSAPPDLKMTSSEMVAAAE